jgi:hypothetical protein
MYKEILRHFLLAKFEYKYSKDAEFYADFKTVEKNANLLINMQKIIFFFWGGGHCECL